MITISGLTARIAGRLLIDNASLSLPSGVKVGLVGRNGTGKSTLFRVITGQLASEAGTVTMPKNARIGQVAQEAPGTDDSLIEIVLAADKERASLLKEAETASDPHRIAEIQTRLTDIGAHSAESRAASILAGLGFDHEAQLRPGKKLFRRLAHARGARGGAVFRAGPALARRTGPTISTSKARCGWKTMCGAIRTPSSSSATTAICLNTAVNAIVHLDQQKLTFYRGSYDQFERQKAENDELQMKAKAKNDAARKHLQSFIDRFKAKATKAKQAQSRVKALERMGTVAAVIETHVQPITFPEPEKQPASPIIAIEGGAVGYTPGQPILKQINLRIDNDDRIALLGSNGNGKSTFAKFISGRLEAEAGAVKRAPSLKIGFFAQHQLDDLIPEQSPVEHVRRLMPEAPEAKVRARVAQMGLATEKMSTAAKDLSGGEKARLLMGLAAFDAPNLLILDEPTNHLDIDSRRALIEALNDYEGAVILISHDRHLIEATVDRLWLVNNGTVKTFDGDMEEYRSLIVQSGKKDDKDKAASNGETANKADQRKAKCRPPRAVRAAQEKDQ